MPSSMFAPPLEEGQTTDDQEIGVERSTRAIRIANQFRNAPPAPAEPPQRASGSRPRLAASSSAGAARSAVVAAQRPARSRVLVLVLALIAVAALAVVAMLMR
jgi:hypothetical protein